MKLGISGQALGCDFIQGYVFYRPMPVEEFEERFLRRGETVPLEEIQS